MPERHVLIVDDDEGIRTSLRFLFEDVGFAVTEAHTGDQALRVIATTAAPQVMLLDRMMPGRDGADVLTALHMEHAWRDRLAIIFMTARNDPPDAHLATLLTQTTIATVRKPFDLDHVVATVERAWATLPMIRDKG